MPALVAGIHVLRYRSDQDVDGRDKPGHDKAESAGSIGARASGMPTKVRNTTASKLGPPLPMPKEPCESPPRLASPRYKPNLIGIAIRKIPYKMTTTKIANTALTKDSAQ